jgi:sugar O-acyltransferase (sialic acid O-acetyltransferase NeuD family)
VKLFIYGAGGAGLETCDLVRRNETIRGRYTDVCFVDDFAAEEEYYGTKRIHFTSCREHMEDDGAAFIVAAGEPAVRKLLYEKVKLAGYSFATLIDETAVISDTALIGEGCIIQAHAVVSSEAVIKENCMFMLQTIVGHHAVVESHCVASPKATVGGHSHVGVGAFLGLGSSMMQGVNIGSGAIVGMGSMVFRNVEDGATVIGSPARVTKGNSEHKVFNK